MKFRQCFIIIRFVWCLTSWQVKQERLPAMKPVSWNGKPLTEAMKIQNTHSLTLSLKECSRKSGFWIFWKILFYSAMTEPNKLKFSPDIISTLLLTRRFYPLKKQQKQTEKAVFSGILKAAENRCRWCSMPISCKQHWTARRLLYWLTETTLTTSYIYSLQNAVIF